MPATPGPTTESLPLLPLDDVVVLPGMAVPLDLSVAESRVAVEAARTRGGDSARVLLAPRLDGRYASVGTIAVIDQVGRLADGDPARSSAASAACASAPAPRGRRGAVGRGTRRREPPPAPRTGPPSWQGVQALVVSTEEARGLAGHGRRPAPRRHLGLADTAGYSPFLTADQKIELLETPDPVARLELATGWARTTSPSRTSPSPSPRTSDRMAAPAARVPARRSSTPYARSCASSRARATATSRTTSGPASRPPTCRRTSARPP